MNYQGFKGIYGYENKRTMYNQTEYKSNKTTDGIGVLSGDGRLSVKKCGIVKNQNMNGGCGVGDGSCSANFCPIPRNNHN